jgi:hypothetical protein
MDNNIYKKHILAYMRMALYILFGMFVINLMAVMAYLNGVV